MARSRYFGAFCCIWLGLTATVRADEATFTFDQVMSAPFADHLTVAPSGAAVAWVFNERGARNIWVGQSPAYQGRRLTAYTEDDGQEISQLSWSADGKLLAYTRGGEDLGGPDPNPLSKAKTPEQTIWIVNLDKGSPRSLGNGREPSIAPSGNRVVFLRGGQVWWASLDSPDKAQELWHLRGAAGSLRWSPSGAMLALVSNRGEHSFLGVYHWAAKKLVWMEPSVDNDVEPAWSPDGKQLAFIRIPTAHPLPFTPRREGLPWSIHVADPGSGKVRQAWRAEAGAGSVFHGLNSATQLWWAAGDRLVFPWERDGWIHLYAVPAKGGPAQLLTPGPFEVEYAALSPDRMSMVYNSNQDDIDRRHVWSVPVSGGVPKALTQGASIEWAPASLGDNKGIVYLRADARRPGQPVLLSGGHPRDLAPQSIPSEFPATRLIEPQQILFPSADGMTIHGQLFLPPGIRPGQRRPAVLFFHGGSRRQMLLGWHYMRYYHNTYALNQVLANRGYIVLSVNYRSGIGYGMEFREAVNYGAQGASEFNDVMGAGLYIRNRPDVDGKHVGLWGGSYGGYLTALGLARASDLFAAGVNIHGVYDWNAEIRNWVRDYDPRKQEETARLAHTSSPVADVKTWRSPVLLIHGDDDRNVPFNESVHLVEDLRKQSVHVEQLIFPDEVHDFLTHARWLQAGHAASDFLDRQLRAKVTR